MGRPPRVPVLLGWERPVIYFVTICVANREPVLANERVFGAFKAAVAKLQHWTVLAAVLMPDHLHVIASSTDARDTQLGNFSAALKRWIRRELDAS
jgi:REP element-mobilizing transposase RayT